VFQARRKVHPRKLRGKIGPLLKRARLNPPSSEGRFDPAQICAPGSAMILSSRPRHEAARSFLPGRQLLPERTTIFRVTRRSAERPIWAPSSRSSRPRAFPQQHCAPRGQACAVARPSGPERLSRASLISASKGPPGYPPSESTQLLLARSILKRLRDNRPGDYFRQPGRFDEVAPPRSQ
jgi:hypothetical protein